MNWTKHSIVQYIGFTTEKKGKKCHMHQCCFWLRRWKYTHLTLTTHTLPLIEKCSDYNYPTVCSLGFFWPRHSLAMLLQCRGKPLTGLELAEASQSDKVWKESWSSSLSLSDLTLMDCFVVQRAGQVLLSYITIYGVFAQQVPFPSLP